MAVLSGQVSLACADLTEYEELRAVAVADPDINIVSDSRSTLTLTIYYDQHGL